MSSVWSSIRDCGGISYIILMLTGVALIDAVLAAVVIFTSKSRQLGIVLSAITLCLGFGIVGVGGYGEYRGRAVVEEVLRAIDLDPDQVRTIREEGNREAAQCVSIGISGSLLPLLLGVVLVTSALLKKNEDVVKQDAHPSRNQKA